MRRSIATIIAKMRDPGARAAWRRAAAPRPSLHPRIEVLADAAEAEMPDDGVGLLELLADDAAVKALFDQDDAAVRDAQARAYSRALEEASPGHLDLANGRSNGGFGA
jgi:hypothetical protein